jgi:hypothetical protein
LRIEPRQTVALLRAAGRRIGASVATSTCRGPDDRTAGLIAYLTDLMTATDSTAVFGTHDPHYVVLDPEEMAGEYHMIFIFDRRFQLTGGWTG